MSWWILDLLQNRQHVELISWVVWVLFSITLHELGHGWAAIRQGDDTPVRLGRMTANPLVHMGLHSIIVFLLCGIAWGMMPVNPHRFRNRRLGEAFVAAAGPAVNLLLAVACVVLAAVWHLVGPDEGELFENVITFLFIGLGLNLVLLGLNLLPIPPLDGSRILATFWRRARGWYDHPQAPLVGMFVFIVLFFMSPIGDILVELVFERAAALMRLAASFA